MIFRYEKPKLERRDLSYLFRSSDFYGSWTLIRKEKKYENIKKRKKSRKLEEN